MKESESHGSAAPIDDVRLVIANLVHAHGPTVAARRLRMSREQVLALTAGVPVRQGTLALARERLCELERDQGVPGEADGGGGRGQR